MPSYKRNQTPLGGDIAAESLRFLDHYSSDSGTAMPDHHDSLAANLKWTAKNTKNFPRGHSTLDAIRRKCLDCSAGYLPAVSQCEQFDCALWPFRMHKNPFHARTGKSNSNAFKTSS
jgi:hypothetical protein